MEVYIFMLCWVIFFGAISQLTAKQICIENDIYEKRTNLFMALIIFSVIIFFAGLRSGVGDTYAYINMFDNFPLMQDFQNYISQPNVKDKGFVFISTIIKTYISNDYSTWLFIIAFISGISVMYTLYKYSSNFGMSAFLFMATCGFTWLFNGMRQFLAVSILFACTELILKRKTILYIILVIVASRIHHSALIMIPVYFIVEEEPWSKRIWLFIGIVIMGIIFTNKFTSILNGVVEEMNYSLVVQDVQSDNGANIVRILVESIPIILAFIYRDKIREEATPIIKVSINMALMTSGFYLLSKILKSGVLIGRFPIYFSLYNLILLPWLINNIFEKSEKRLVNFIMVICYLVFFYYQMVVAWGGLEYVSKILNIRY